MKIKQLNYAKGKFGEEEAKQFLIDKGFSFIEANFKNDTGEIDLIMSDNDWLVFVEVKYKSDDYMGLPEEMIDKRKLSQVKRVADYYLMTHSDMKKLFIKYRIDAVCILGLEIRYYKSIYA